MTNFPSHIINKTYGLNVGHLCCQLAFDTGPRRKKWPFAR